MNRFFLLSLLLVLSACAGTGEKPKEEKPQLVLKATDFNALPGWRGEFDVGAVTAFEKSCARIMKAESAKPFFTSMPESRTYGHWQKICTNFAATDKSNPALLKQFFENNFQPYTAYADTTTEGLFTGYYEAALNGS